MIRASCPEPVSSLHDTHQAGKEISTLLLYSSAIQQSKVGGS